MREKKSELIKLIKEWYPTFNTHWEKGTNCPCEQCFEIRVDKLQDAIRTLLHKKVGEKLEKDNSVDEIYDIGVTDGHNAMVEQMNTEIDKL